MAKVKLFLTLNKREKERGCETPLWSCESPDSVTYANRFFSFLFSFLFLVLALLCIFGHRARIKDVLKTTACTYL